MSNQNQMFMVELVDVVNMSGSEIYFEVTVGTHGLRKYKMRPGEVKQLEDGYTRPIPVAEGRQPRPSILEQLVGGPNRVVRLEDADPDALASLRAQYAPAPVEAPAKPRAAKAQQG